MWQDQAAEGDNEIRGHLKNLVSPLFLPTLLVLADVFSQSAFASETAQSDIYPLWDDKANIDKFIENVTKMQGSAYLGKSIEQTTKAAST